MRLIIVCGWPLSGKTEIARLISQTLEIHWIDIDDIRLLNFGKPNPYPNASNYLMEIDKAEMGGAYELLNTSAKLNLQIGRQLIITATFSRKKYWKNLQQIGNPASMKIIWCKPINDSIEEIKRRLSGRQFGINCWSTVNSIERYLEVKTRFENPPPPYLELNTSPPNSVEECVQKAMAYLLD